MNENITISKNNLLEAYKNGSTENKNLLERLCGKEAFRLNVMDRVKTFYDATIELGEGHSLIKEYRQSSTFCPNTLAYLSLCIITAALNEGWKPTFAENEHRYYPYFRFFTQDEINAMSGSWCADVRVFDMPHGSIAGIAFAHSDGIPACADGRVCSQLCFKTRELADYAGKQFIELYRDYYLK